MKIARSSTIDWYRNPLHIRAGAGLQLKRLLTGTPGTPENYMCNIAKNEGDYASPRHRHNFDQIRIALEGDMRISPNQVVKQSQIGYFPEGTYYGPYDDAGRARTIMIVQFGGASGSGYMGDTAEKGARDALLKEGAFRDGIFHRTSGEGKKNQDAYEPRAVSRAGADAVLAPPRMPLTPRNAVNSGRRGAKPRRAALSSRRPPRRNRGACIDAPRARTVACAATKTDGASDAHP